MKFSEIWLREWVNPPIGSAALSHQITMAGLEVDVVEPVSGNFQGVIVGEVVECIRHPKSNRLRLTKVNVGDEHLLDIVCGASNCRVYLKVVVAIIGAMLPGDLKIKKTKFSGKISEGILCTFRDLGITHEYDGIIELPKDAPIGADIRDYLKLNDSTIEISIPPNRADCMSIMGIARDISAFNKITLNKPHINTVSATIDTVLPVQVTAPQGCPRYLCRVVKGINIKATSPLWMREKLRRCGICSINVVLDVINYVLMELGQPIHAFDFTRLEGGIVVRMAKDGEALTLVDGQDIQLSSDTLVIADYSKVLSVAGIVGGEYSQINPETEDILLESAFFAPLWIRGVSRRKGMKTYASQRYERGVDPAFQYQAIERATHLLVDLCNGRAGPVIDVTHENELPRPITIQLRRKKLDRLLGHVVPKKQVNDILNRLHYQVTEQDETWLVLVPTWRFDIEIEEDLIEEIVRIYGYNNIPEVPICADLIMTKRPEANLNVESIKTLLINHGFQEVITYSFVDPKVQSLLHPGEEGLVLLNPISRDMSVMRLSLWTGLLSVVVYNQNRQKNHLRLFETGLCFIPDNTAYLGIRQDTLLSGAIVGYNHDEHWDLKCKPVDFYDLKGEVESILELTGQLPNIKFRKGTNAALHPGQNAEIYLHGEQIGLIGLLHPELECKLDLNIRTLLFELQWKKISRRLVPCVKEISRFPANRRDISVVVEESVSVEDVLEECKKIGENHIVGVNLFDVYRGNGIAKGHKSLAISLVLQDVARTLETGEIATTITRCVEALRKRFQAYLRD